MLFGSILSVSTFGLFQLLLNEIGTPTSPSVGVESLGVDSVGVDPDARPLENQYAPRPLEVCLDGRLTPSKTSSDDLLNSPDSK